MHLPPVEYYRRNKLCRDVVNEYQPGMGRPFDPKRLISAFNTAFQRHYPHGETVSRQQLAFMGGEAEVVKQFILWWDAGRQIFAFPDALIASFLETDVDEVPVSFVRSPYRNYYLKFGTYTQIPIPGIAGRFLDGAYVYEIEDGLCFETTHFIPSANTGASGRPFALVTKGSHTVGEALERGLAEMRAQRDNSARESRFFRDTRTEAMAILESGIPLFQSCLRLVFNCLAFINSHPDQVEDSFLDAPRPLVAKLERAATPKDVQRNTSKLMSAGFAKVRLCGRLINDEMVRPEGIGSEVRSHWRRGHWRLQPCGPQLAQLRLTWVRPTVVRADKGPPELGHIYEPPAMNS